MHPVAIDRALLEHLAKLARLHLPPGREEVLRQRLERIVAAFSTLQQVATTAAPRTAASPPHLRPDLPEPPMAPADVLANAPAQAGQCFLVPRVVD